MGRAATKRPEPRRKDLISLADVDARQMRALFELARRLKRHPRAAGAPLSRRSIGLLFEKPSVRTRVSFEVAIHQLGGHAVYLGAEAGLGQREDPQDVAKVLSRYLDGLIVRTFAHSVVETLGRVATIPVINGLSDQSHPCQVLSDLFTVQERRGTVKGVRIAFVGDGNNVLHSLLHGCSQLGAHLAYATPSGYEPDAGIVAQALRMARESGGTVVAARDPREAVVGADVVYTDVWASMGQEAERAQRRQVFRDFQVNARLLALAKPGALVMHCLPAHRGEEITADVLTGPQAIVLDQAENRLHVHKAVLIEWIGPRRRR